MNDTLKTILFAGVAALLAVAAFQTMPGIREPAIFDDTGEEFFPGFTDPLAAHALEVVEFDAQTAELSPFRVEMRDGRWSIPSHHGYPADAKDRMAEAAGMLIGLTKASVRSDDPAEHALFGVVDPNDPGIETEGRGMLVSFEDGSGNAIASLIIGKEVEGRSGQRYVRAPGKKRTYVAELPHVPSTKFGDWIETNLLDVASFDIDELLFDNYQIDEASFTRIDGTRTSVVKKDGTWAIADLAPGEKVDEDALREVTSALGSLSIVGVRKKPDGLTRDLTRSKTMQLDERTVLSLQARGFFVSEDGHLYSNEGDLVAMTDDGIVYTLRFGEILYGSGEEVTAGGAAEAEAQAAENTPEEGSQSGAAHRFLMVTASFSADRIRAPADAALSDEELEKRKQARQRVEEIAAAVRTFEERHGAPPDSLARLTEPQPPAGPANGDSDDGTTEAPLLASLDPDPWGNAYQLVAKDDGVFAVASFAQDGVEGGETEAADVRSDDLAREDAFAATAKEWEDYRKKVEEGEERAAKLSARFAPWYYVIDDASFKKLRVDRAALIAEIEAADELDGAAAGSAPDAPAATDAPPASNGAEADDSDGGDSGEPPPAEPPPPPSDD